MPTDKELGQAVLDFFTNTVDVPECPPGLEGKVWWERRGDSQWEYPWRVVEYKDSIAQCYPCGEPRRIVIEHPHICMQDGVPYIEGTRVPAQRIYDWHKKGVPFVTLFQRYPRIPRAHLLSAVAFFYDNLHMVKDGM